MALSGLLLALFVATLSSTVVTTALPKIIGKPGVRLGDGVAGDAQVEREGLIRRQPRARATPSGCH
ncbi:hypothetical protein ACFPOI_25760 [Nonomuraea angiospora]|uniref:Uncharacterized protein n=1 Tax=Nonomuraea angiospora TaxID=46172 RepID=A0ABR9LP60_9ACTN|nr:hypothetical protein [Nonomuraea angiospora]MBE1582434.1 hypothetical protein [Nonomuraea angiospora]